MHADTIHRRTNGTIDIDRYRARVLSERAAVRTDFFKGLSKFVRPAVAVAILACTVYAMPGRDPARNDGMSKNVIATIASADSNTK